MWPDFGRLVTLVQLPGLGQGRRGVNPEPQEGEALLLSGRTVEEFVSSPSEGQIEDNVSFLKNCLCLAF